MPPAAADSVTPFKLLANGTILVPVRVNGAGPFPFVLDTGSTRTLVSARLVARLKLVGAGGATLFTPAGVTPQSLVRIDTIDLDGRSAGPLAAGIAHWDALDARNAAGLIGQDVLAPQVYTIDYRERRIHWGITVDSSGKRVPLTIGPDHVLVRVPASNGRSGQLRLTPDSGAATLVLFGAAEWASETSTTPLDAIRTIGGSRQARRVRVDRLDIGGVELRGQIAYLLPSTAATDSSFGDGLLPLHLFTRVTFHGPEGYMVFEGERHELRTMSSSEQEASDMSEIADLREHLDRYRAVTLQHFDLLSDEELTWRPRRDAFTCGQQLLHIVQTEDCFVRGLFGYGWQLDRLRFPQSMPGKEALREMFATVRADTWRHLASLSSADLDLVRRHGFSTYEATVRSWLWFILEHELHHKGQLSEYLRAMGKLPPYFGIPLPLGTRPDIQARADLGGV
jgi:uncharacterized damage-inducible protein DinB